MERPGLLEFAVYGLILTVTGAWVYALPPFDYEPGPRLQFAHLEPRSETVTDVSGLDTAPRNTQDSEAEDPEARIIQGGDPEISDPEISDPEGNSEDGEAQQIASVSDPVEQPPEPEPDLLVVTARSLNMRAGPDANSALVGNYPRGALVEKVDTSGNWVLVRTEDDRTGYMYSGYLETPED